jgi:hypothetical protein
MSTTPLRPDDILRRASAVGNYYGFTSLSSAAALKRLSSKNPYPENLALESLDPNAREVAGFLKHVRDAGLAPSTLQPLFLWHTNAAPGRSSPKEILIQFHALGVDHAIADAVLIRAIRALITDLAKEAPRVRVNSMGDKETRSRFARELGVFFRKQAATLPEACVNCAKRLKQLNSYLLVNHVTSCPLQRIISLRQAANTLRDYSNTLSQLIPRTSSHLIFFHAVPHGPRHALKSLAIRLSLHGARAITILQSTSSKRHCLQWVHWYALRFRRARRLLQLKNAAIICDSFSYTLATRQSAKP